jgi:hypothetical protein
MSVERSWVIGAAPDCDLVVDVPTVSSRHCRLIEGPTGFLLEDLHSTNGTYVNGYRIAKRVSVQPSDVILLGSKVAMPWPQAPLPVAVLNGVSGMAPAAELSPVESEGSPQARRWPVSGPVIGVTTALVLSLALLIVALVSGGKPGRRNEVSASSGLSHEGETSDRPDTEETTKPVTDEAPAVSTSKLAPVKTALLTTPADLESAARPHESAIVWLGARLGDYVFPLGTGWFARPDAVVTTAAVVGDLENFSHKGWEVVAYDRHEMVTVKALRRHPEYDPESNLEKPGSRNSIVSNVGLAVVERPADAVCPVAALSELASLPDDPGVLAVGFESQLADKEPFDELKVKIFRTQTALARSEFVASKSSHVYALDIPVPKCSEGSPIFNRRGHVVGVMAVDSGGPRMVPINRLLGLLGPTRN